MLRSHKWACFGSDMAAKHVQANKTAPCADTCCRFTKSLQCVRVRMDANTRSQQVGAWRAILCTFKTVAMPRCQS